MERLTCNKLNKLTAGCYFVNLASKEEATKYRMLAESAPKYEEIYKKLAEYENAEEQGLLLRLPCKVGDSIYQPIRSLINEYKTIGLVFDITSNEWLYEVSYEIDGNWYKTVCDFKSIGKTVFLTKEEAEQALKQIGGVE